MGKSVNIAPNLLLVGFQKCGSSSLFDLLCEHPDIVGTSPKETFALVDSQYEHYDENHNINSENFNWSEYFEETKDEVKYFLEGSVCNFYQDQALDYAQKHKECKIIFLIRDPLLRFLSTYNYLGKGGEFLPIGTSLDEFYNLIIREKIEKEMLKYSLEHGRYSKYIDKWFSKIGSENVHITSFELLTKNLENELLKICEFLEIKNQFISKSLPSSNVTKRLKNENLHYFLNRLFGGKGRLKKWGLANIYNRLNRTSDRKKPYLSNELRRTLEDYYKQETSRFKDYL